MKIFAALFFASVFYQVAAQPPQVPHKMEFADITLTIRDDARREIQQDVDALTQSLRHYNIKAERAKTYFPIIEKIFREEEIPDDFKYLVLQESALIADAVSVSNAVGFWQFKDYTAIEMGLRVDKEIDERLNIVSSSRAAARYIKKNNVFFNNWIYALQAYQMGAGGVLKSVKESQSGVRHMEITSKTYWYVKKYLAHKIAYEPGVAGKALQEVVIYTNSNGKSLSVLSKEVGVEESELRNYNKWTKSGAIPGDRTYFVLIPLTANPSVLASIARNEKRIEPQKNALALKKIHTPVTRRVNGINTIKALPGENAGALAARAGVDPSRFVHWNDLSEPTDMLMADNFYFLGRKRVRASENFHKVLPGETLWSISQLYGVQKNKLIKYNRIESDGNPSPGTMLWLASKRPKSDPVSPSSIENAMVVDNDETFSWSANGSEKTAVVTGGNTDSVIDSSTPVKPVILVVQKPTDSLQILQESAITESNLTDTTRVQPEKIMALKTEHLVQAGETLYGIAKIYNIGVMDLVGWNKLDLQQGIKPGQVLKLFDGQTFTSDARPEKEVVITPKTVQDVVHEVKSSDTLYSIARQYGVTIKDLMDWNEKKDFSLAVGEKLKIHPRQ